MSRVHLAINVANLDAEIPVGQLRSATPGKSACCANRPDLTADSTTSNTCC